MIPSSRRLTRARSLGVALLVAGAALLAAAGATQARAAQGSGEEGPASGGPTVEVVEVAGRIDRPMARFLGSALDQAGARETDVLVIRLDSPGALGGDWLPLADAVSSSSVPVVVWVGPPGAQASGAAYLLAQSAHLVAAAPTAVLGPPFVHDLETPRGATLVGLPPDPAGLAEHEVVVAVPDGETGVEVPPDAELPEFADRSAVRTLDQTALASRGVAQVVATSLPELLRELDGRRIDIGGAVRALDVDPVTANVRFNDAGLGARTLHTVANPLLAYLLLVAGVTTLLFEVFQPGFGVAGVSGLVILGLAAYALAVLPTALWALGVLVVGLLLLAADLALARLGLLSAGGVAAFVAGSARLFGGPASLDPPWWLIGVLAAGVAAFFGIVMTTVLRAQGNQALTGADAVVGKVGVVRSVLNPEGHVFVGGALWRARAPADAGRVRTGTKVRVLGLNDKLTLDVEVVEADEPSSVA